MTFKRIYLTAAILIWVTYVEIRLSKSFNADIEFIYAIKQIRKDIDEEGREID